MRRTLTLSYVVTVLVGISIIGTIVGIATHETNAAVDNTEITSKSIENITESEKEEILWLARIMYSETKKPHEMALVGWVARNRVESGYTGYTYKAVALSSKQFSGLNPTDQNYHENISRGYKSGGGAWRSAISIARAVYFADASLRPLPQTVLHFYSPKAVRYTPSWARGLEPVHTITDNEKDYIRFAFYAGVK